MKWQEKKVKGGLRFRLIDLATGQPLTKWHVSHAKALKEQKKEVKT